MVSERTLVNEVWGLGSSLRLTYFIYRGNFDA
jgi:hypothetical protein